MSQFNFSVSLRFTGPTINIAEISKLLGKTPALQQIVGMPRMNPNGMPLEGIYKTSHCSFSIDRIDNEELHKMLARLCAWLEPHTDLLRSLRSSGARIEFFIGWFSEFNSGDTFHYSLLRKIGELGIDLALDVYAEDN
jgi:hypothetical protein